jgi:hypothetical protein
VISFCFTHKNRLDWNIGNENLPLFKNCLLTLRSCLESLNIEKYEICISSWDDDQDFQKLDNFIKENFPFYKIAIKTIDKKEIFSRGKGLNEAFSQSCGDTIFFLDVDMLFMRSEVISRGIKAVNNNKAYFPICYSMWEDGSGDWRPLGYGNCAVSRNALSQIKWIDKKSWGQEDDIFHAEIKKKYEIVREKCPGYYHQWHPSLAPKGTDWNR